MDRPNDERPGQSRHAAALRLDNVTQDGCSVRAHVPAVPAREAVRTGDAVPTRFTALVSKRLVAKKPDAVWSQFGPDPVRPHSIRIVDERSDFVGGRGELALVNVSDYQRLPVPLVRLRIPMRISCSVASNVATANRMKPVQLLRTPNTIAPAADPSTIRIHSRPPSRCGGFMRPPSRRSRRRSRPRGRGSRARG